MAATRSYAQTGKHSFLSHHKLEDMATNNPKKLTFIKMLMNRVMIRGYLYTVFRSLPLLCQNHKDFLTPSSILFHLGGPNSVCRRLEWRNSCLWWQGVVLLLVTSKGHVPHRSFSCNDYILSLLLHILSLQNDMRDKPVYSEFSKSTFFL